VIVLALGLLLTAQGTGDSLRLADALSHARLHRGRVAGAGAAVAAARAEVRVAGTIPDPVGSYSYTDDPPRQHVSLQQPLDWLLTRSADRSAARAGTARAEADSAQTLADLDAAVRAAFFGVIAAREVRRLTTEQAAIADSLVTIADRRLAAGDISALERDQLELEATRAAQRRSLATEQLAVMQSRLAGEIGWDPGTTLPPVAGSLSDGLEAGAAPALPDAAARDRLPGVRAALADSIVAAERARSADRARVPLPSVEVGADWADPSVPGRTLALVGLSLPLPLWHHGTGNLELARADAAQAAARAREARAAMAWQLRESAIHLEATARRARVARDSLQPMAQRLRARATLAYQAGETGVIPVLEALRTEREVTADMVDQILAFQEARAEWQRLLGGAP
jgi:outer membrane protein, heavy metal efflux system